VLASLCLTIVFSRCTGAPNFVAVNNIDLDMYSGQIFALLGHNGAGKSTTINMLTGLYPPTQGDALVYGQSIVNAMPEIRRDLGVCPQHDILFDHLTVKEHLELFCAIKCIPAELIDRAVEEMINHVGLTDKRDSMSGLLSGGQKRKLSVGIALIGGSKVVFLDEPTSGMDPYSRRSTWELLRNGKQGRIIILTTHFMDEGECIVVGVLSRWWLTCVLCFCHVCSGSTG
jgi:ATP-binding cassette subfamily A (ABC1) protein 3